MRRGFYILTTLMLCSVAFAEENNALLPKDVFFQPGGGLRVRYLNLNDATGGAFSQEENSSSVTHRFQFDMLLHKGEYFQSFARFIHLDQWGRASSASSDSSPGSRDSFSQNNGLFVNQAWGLWKVADSLGIKFGRSPIVLGRGFTYGENDWFNLPYTFDHIDMLWDWEVLELSIIAAKVQELVQDNAKTSVNPDPEENHIIVDANIKGFSDYINTLNFHFSQISRDIGSNDGGATLQKGLDAQRFGFDMGISARQVFGGIFISYVSGQERGVTSSGATEQFALETEMGYLIPGWSDMRFWGGYHIDSGDATAGNAGNDTYDSFYYDVYGHTGKMDMFRWGNLTSAKFGFDVKVSSEVTVGSEFFRLSKTQAEDSTINFGDAGSFIMANIKSGDVTLSSGSTDLGDEFDMWVNYDLPSGMMLNTTFSAFFPGDVFTKASTTSGSKMNSMMFQVISQISIFF